jgi:hypothetical protein
MPPISPFHTLPGAINDLINTPKRLVMSFAAYEPRILLLGMIITLGLSRFLRIQFIRYLPFVQIYFVFSLVYILNYSWNLNKTQNRIPSNFNWVENANISNAIFLLMLLALFLTYDQNDRSKVPKEILINISIIVIAFTFALVSIGFGSTSGIQGKISTGPVFLVGMCLTWITIASHTRKIRSATLLTVGFFLLSLIVIVFLGSSQNPYRSDDLATMKHKTLVGNHDSTIFLTSSKSRQIQDLRSSAFDAGFKVSTPTINLVYPSGVGYGYVLGGRQSPTIQFVWFGYPASLEQSLFLFEASDRRFDYRNAWILKSTDSSYGIEKRDLEILIDQIQVRSSRRFPVDYSLIYRDSSLELWKPITK